MQRRNFIISLSSAIASIASGCRKPVQKILPSVLPDEINQTGKSIYYNTVYPNYGIPYGISVKTREGRPLKIEANPLSPLNPNGTNATIQAAIYSLYAPSRFRKASVNGSQADLKTAMQSVKDLISQKKNKQNILVLSRRNNSILLNKLKRDIEEAQSVRFFNFPLSAEQDIPFSFFESLTFGKEKKYIISLGADILGASKYSLLFQNRLFDTNGNNNIELLTAEPILSQTGIATSIRETRSPAELEMLAAIILQKVTEKKHGQILSFPVIPQEYAYLYDSPIIKKIENEEKADFYLFCGDFLSEVTRAAARKLNGFDINSPANLYYAESERLKKSISPDSIIIYLDYNPYYSDTEIARITGKVPKQNKISLSQYFDETAKNCGIHIPASNFLEDWNIYKFSGSNTIFIQQPIVHKLNKDSLSPIDFLLTLFDNDRQKNEEYYYLRELVNLNDRIWRQALQKGYFIPDDDNVLRIINENTIYDIEKHQTPAKIETNKELSLIALPSVYQYYGLERNNPFLLELPDPLTKLSWDNAVMLSENTASEYKLEQGDIVKISTGKNILELPLMICNACADNLLIVKTGFGTSAESDFPISGKNVFGLFENSHELAVNNVSIEKTNRKKDLTIHKPAQLIKLNQNIKDTDFTELLHLQNKKYEHIKPYPSFGKDFEYLDTKWEMEIDLTKCTGCNACVVACQIENNIPLVGAKAIRENRAMFWLNINSYIYENQENISGEFQPLMCQQCENAPCETVCPVGATTHSPEGINEMTYNRCVGSRYCMVNCPYEIRVFNYDDYNKNIKAPLELLLNPDVTVRSRGVSEKCTFCIQRINEYEREIQLGNNPQKLQTACQQACPTGAIDFGNILSKKFKTSKSGYKLLENLNTLPAITYISKFRNNVKRNNI
jgi:molybdopterin-containing oxidoreductase family iron-sulfur binding subunit